MRNVTVTIAGAELTLHYSMDVLFDVNEKFGSLDGALNALQEPGREGFEALLWMARRLAKEGELLRRERGEPARDLPASVHHFRQSLRQVNFTACILICRQQRSPDHHVMLRPMHMAERHSHHPFNDSYGIL